MGVQFIGAMGGTTSFTAVTHRIGDLFICMAFADGSTTNPTIGTAGWTTITNTTDGTSCSISAAWKVATTNAEASGTWTGATRLICGVWRNVLNTATPIGTFAAGAGTTNTVNYAARTLAASNVAGASWFAAFAAHRSTDTTLESPPANMTLRLDEVDANCEMALFDTNGPATGDWPSTNVTITGTASGWQTMVLEIKANSITNENYKTGFGVPIVNGVGQNNGVISFGERIR